MRTTVAEPLDYGAICKRAIGSLQRRGVCEWLEREELIGEGCLALSMATPTAEGLAVTIARRAMVNAIRKNERRERGRVEVRSGHGADVNADEVTEGDQWDATIQGKRAQCEPANLNLWEAMKALPARQYQAITLVYWGSMSEAGAAIEMGISQQAVHVLLEKAKKNIREGVVIAVPQTITNMRGEETRRTVLSGRTEVA